MAAGPRLVMAGSFIERATLVVVLVLTIQLQPLKPRLLHEGFAVRAVVVLVLTIQLQPLKPRLLHEGFAVRAADNWKIESMRAANLETPPRACVRTASGSDRI